MRRFWPLAVALGLSLVGTALAAPRINQWECTPRVIFGGTGTNADTLPHLVNGVSGAGSTDSVVTSDSINVFGARYIAVTVQSTGADSMAAPVVQVRLPSGQWSAYSNGSVVPPSGADPISPMTTTTLVNQVTKTYYVIVSEPDIAGAYLVPLTNDYIRLRLKSSDVRFYTNGASTPVNGVSGKFTFTAFVWR